MAIEVTLPDGNIAEFPDGTPRETIKAALRKRFPPPAKTMEELTPGLSTNPTDGMSRLDLFRAGVGKSLVDTGEGLAQLVGAGPSRAEVDERRQLEGALMDTGAGVAGNIAGQVGQAFIPVAGAAKLASYAGRAAPFVRAGLQGAALAGAQAVGEDDSRLANTATGAGLGVLGQGIASGASVLARRALPTDEIAKSIAAARALNIPLNVSQVTTSGPVRAAQAITKYLPFSGAASSARAQQEAFNRAVGKTFGVKDASTLSDDVMKSARRNLSDEFESIYSGKQVEITPDIARRMAAVERNAFEDMTEAEAQVVRNQLNKVLSEAQDGVISGKKYQALRTSLQDATDEGKIGRMVKKLRSELDDAAAESLGPDDAARLAKVRSGWANLRTTENALKQVGGAAGNVSPASLWNLIRKGSTKEMRMLAKVGQNTLKDVVPDSGSAQRTMWQNILTTGGAGGIGFGLGVPLLGLAKIAAGGALAGRALNSNAASRLLQQGKPTAGLARIVSPAPRLLPAASLGGTSAALDIGTVYGYDRNDPRYQGD